MIRSLRNLFIYAIVIIFSLEVVFYFGDIPKEYKPLSYPFQFQNHLDKEIGWTNLRSASIDFVYDGNTRGYFKKNNTVNHITNSAGYRGAEIPLKKAKDGDDISEIRNAEAVLAQSLSKIGEAMYKKNEPDIKDADFKEPGEDKK